MSYRFPDNGTQSRVEANVGTAADLTDALTILALIYFDTVGTGVHYLWKDDHARGFGDVGPQLYGKFNGTGGSTLHEFQTDDVLVAGEWQFVAVQYRYSDGYLGVYHALLGEPLKPVNIWYEVNNRVGMEDNTAENILVGSRQAATYNHDRNFENPVEYLINWKEIVSLDDLREQQYRLYAAVQTADMLFMHRYDENDLVGPVVDLSPAGANGTPYNVLAGPTLPTALFSTEAGDDMSLIGPCSSLAKSGAIAPAIYVGPTNGRREEMMKVGASLAADAVWELTFEMPPTLPSGTPYLRLKSVAAATSGTANVNPAWRRVPDGDSLDPASLGAEGVTPLIWGSGDSGVSKRMDIILDEAVVNSAIQADDTLKVEVTFTSSGWTLPADSYWKAFIVFK